MEEQFKSYREGSTHNYGIFYDPSVKGAEKLTDEQLQTGALLRIADATEKMAGNITMLQNDLEFYKSRTNELREENNRLWRSNCALRGHLKRLKNKKQNDTIY